MNILLVVATKSEIGPLLPALGLKKSGEGPVCAQGIFKNLNIDVLITGIGAVSTVYFLTRLLQQKKYDLAINAGIAGSFNRNLKLGDVVCVNEDCFADLGIEDGGQFITLFESGLLQDDGLILKDGMLKPVLDLPAFPVLLLAKGITVNTVSGSAQTIGKLYEKFSPDIETMEGAAFIYVCMLEGIQCMQIRSVSNYVEIRDKGKWNIPLAVENLKNAIITIFENY